MLHWEKKLVLGVPEIDREHEELVKKTNEMLTALKSGNSKEEIIRHINFLADYVIKHFNSEEKLQAKYNYPDIANHKQIHSQFKGTVTQLIQDIDENGLTTSKKIEISKMTMDWLLKHIGVEDKKLADFILENRKNT